MNPALSVQVFEGIGGIGAKNVAEMLSLPSLASERSAKSDKLSISVQEIFTNVASALEGFVVRTIEKREAEEFRSTFESVFPKYLEGALGLSFLAQALVPSAVLETLSAESFSMMEAEFRDQALESFGATVRDQAVFTVWTLRRISDVCRKIAQAPPVGNNLKSQDAKLFSMFVQHSMRTRFHLDCLLKSMDLKKPIYPAVLETLIDGLRSAVDAYAWARRALELRVPHIEPAEAPELIWDDEDDQLVREASLDMLSDPA